MILFNIEGGLGNQMFEYALYWKLISSGKQVVLDLFAGEKYLDSENYPSLFKICELDKNHLKKKLELFCKVHKIIRKVFKNFFPIYKEKTLGEYDKNVFELDNVYLKGYWFNEKYFLDCRKDLLDLFKFKKELNQESKEILTKIQSCKTPVSIHIRLGDYMSQESNRKQLGGICTPNYYKNAIQYIKSNVDNPTFFVFSDEPQKAAEIVGVDNKFIVDVNDRFTGWMDMFLISKCKHQIISNSTFSWWGAWLNTNEEKIVIAPKKWVNYPKVSDEIIPSNWIRIDS